MDLDLAMKLATIFELAEERTQAESIDEFNSFAFTSLANTAHLQQHELLDELSLISSQKDVDAMVSSFSGLESEVDSETAKQGSSDPALAHDYSNLECHGKDQYLPMSDCNVTFGQDLSLSHSRMFPFEMNKVTGQAEPSCERAFSLEQLPVKDSAPAHVSGRHELAMTAPHKRAKYTAPLESHVKRLPLKEIDPNTCSARVLDERWSGSSAGGKENYMHPYFNNEPTQVNTGDIRTNGDDTELYNAFEYFNPQTIDPSSLYTPYLPRQFPQSLTWQPVATPVLGAVAIGEENSSASSLRSFPGITDLPRQPVYPGAISRGSSQVFVFDPVRNSVALVDLATFFQSNISTTVPEGPGLRTFVNGSEAMKEKLTKHAKSNSFDNLKSQAIKVSANDFCASYDFHTFAPAKTLGAASSATSEGGHKVKALSEASPSLPKPRPNSRYKEGSLYTPRFIRGKGTEREGLCTLCESPTWFNMKHSTYWYHMNYVHGVNHRTDTYYDLPQRYRCVRLKSPINNPPLISDSKRRETADSKYQGYCNTCNEWIDLYFFKWSERQAIQQELPLVYKGLYAPSPSADIMDDDGCIVVPVEEGRSFNHYSWFKHAQKCFSCVYKYSNIEQTH